MRKSSLRLVAALVGLASCLPFLPALTNDFTDWDDPLYLTMNPHVRSGINVESLRWAFTTDATSNWHPVTWIVHEAAWSAFGASPAGHHALSVVLHGANAALLFLVMALATGARGRSAAVALLFGVHPLRVESVAWASELKDVLTALFWMLGMLAYLRWRKSKRPAALALVAAALALGLLAKPMLVTFPFALLLFDRWPLGRWKGTVSPPRPLWTEKAPLFLLVLASCAITLFVQRSAMPTGEQFSLGEDVANAVVSYVAYLGKIVWPTGLSPFYPHMGPTLPVWQVAASAILLLAITTLAFRLRERAPYVWFGWLWYVGTLVPVIGIVRVGGQAMADRYTYIPSIGIAVAVVWGVGDLLRERARVTESRAVAALLLPALILAPLAFRQTRLWRDSITLFTHALSLDPKNPLAHNNLGIALEAEGRTDDAIAHYRQALVASPRNRNARGNLAYALLFQGKKDEAERELRAMLEVTPNDAAALDALGEILVARGRAAEALPVLEAAVRVDDGFGKARFDLSLALAALGRSREAVEQAERAEAAGYREGKLYAHLAWQYLSAGRIEDARRALEALVSIEPEFGAAHSNLAAVYEKLGRIDDARREADRARSLGFEPPPDLLQRLAR